MTICVIVPCHNRREVTAEGISRIWRAVEYLNDLTSEKCRAVLLVVDDGSTDGTSRYLEQNFPDVILLQGSGFLWWTGAVNLGIDYALRHFGDLAAVVLQNDDVYVKEDWLAMLIKSFKSHSNALIGCATVLAEDYRKIHYGGRRLHSWFAYETRINAGRSLTDFAAGHMEASFDLYGRGLLIPAEVFNRVGLFNSCRFRHRGDMDLPLRAKLNGFQLLVSYDALVFEQPQHGYSLDSKRDISIRECLRLLTDFRSSHNFKFVFFYSWVATQRVGKFPVFFICNLFLNLRGLAKRTVKYYIK